MNKGLEVPLRSAGEESYADKVRQERKLHEELAKEFPCPDCDGTGLSMGWMDDPCESCASTGVDCNEVEL